MKRLRYYASVAAMFTKLSIQSELEYPFVLIGHVLANCIQWVVGFATIKFVVDQFGSIGGWGYESLAFLYGMSVLQHALAVVFYIQTWYMGYMVIEGEFDWYMLRPMNLVFQFLFCYEELGEYSKAYDIWIWVAHDLEKEGFEIEKQFPLELAEKCRAILTGHPA